MTKNEYQRRRESWRKALSEGRVVRNGDGMSLKSYSTVERALAAVAEQVAQGLPAAIAKDVK